MEANRETSIDFVVGAEGGFVVDKGGKTKFGISQKSYPALDIESLTVDQAREIYARDYWNRLRCSELPGGLDLLVFDCAVNQGATAAAQMLQKAAGTAPDGIVGPRTVAAAQSVTVNEYAARRMFLYAKSADFDANGLGWSRRLIAAVTKAVRLTKD